MATLEDVLDIQSKYNILQAPIDKSSVKPQALSQGARVQVNAVASTPSTLQVALVNHTQSNNAWAYVSGLDINRDGKIFLLQSDGKTVYYPTSPSDRLQPLQADCNIKLGPPGSTTTITIPQAAGGRIYFIEDNQLTFYLNPGPALVEPSSSNPADANYNFLWDFCEFTFNSFQLFANITYVDFVGLPIALKLQNGSGNTYEVKGMTSSGLDSVCSQLVEQNSRDSAGWDRLIIKGPSGANLRALSPVKGMDQDANLFLDYYAGYVDQVWSRYTSTPLSVDTQGEWGVVSGQVTNGQLTFPGVVSFDKPSAKDIFFCNTGPFSNTAGEVGNISARIAAALNRSTLLTNSKQPDGEQISLYYQDSVTNHYSRIVHSINDSGKGYAFAYDDVSPSDDANVAGTVADSDPTLLTVSIGGSNVAARSFGPRESARSGGRTNQLIGGRRIRRDLFGWTSAEDEKELLAQRNALVSTNPEQEMRQLLTSASDLEEGTGTGAVSPAIKQLGGTLVPTFQPAVAEGVLAQPVQSLVPAVLREKIRRLLQRVEGSAAYTYAQPVVDMVVKAAVLVLSLSLKTLASRAAMVLFLVLCSFLLGFFGRPAEARQLLAKVADPTPEDAQTTMFGAYGI